MTGSRIQLGASALLLLGAWVAWRYTAVEAPHAVALMLAVTIWLAVFTLATLGFGAPIWRWIAGEAPSSAEAWLVSATLGAAVLTVAAGILGATGLLGAFPLLSVLGAGVVLGALRLSRRRFDASVSSIPVIPACVLGLGGLLTLLAVATPSPFYDQVHYHLAFPERWLQLGGIEIFPRHDYSYLPANMGLLYTYALVGPGVWAAQAIHWWMGLVAAASAWVIARKLGAGDRGGAWAAAVFVATPSVLLSATWAASDLGLAAYGGVALLMAVGPVAEERQRGPGWYAACGALCGVAFGCKYLALATVAMPVGVIVAGAAILAWSRGDRRRAMLSCALPWALGLGVLILPWALRNTILTGDPVYPFYAETFARWLGTGALETVEGAQRIAPAETASAFRAALSLRTFEPLGAAGAIGPLWLILLPLWLGTILFGRRSPAGLLLAAGVITGIVVWAQFRQLGRYLLPVLVPAAAGIGLAVEQLFASVPGRLRAGIAVLLGFVMLWSLQGGFSELTFDRISCTFGRSDTRELLSKYVSYWPALDVVNDDLPQEAKLLLVGESRSLHLERDVVVEDPFRRPYLVELAEKTASPAEMSLSLRGDGITHLLYNEHEADRIARLGHREGYFDDASGEVLIRLRGFLDDCLELIETAGPVRIYRLGERCLES